MKILIKHFFSRTAIDVFDQCETHFRVNVLDLDINLHMNNGRYLSLMDLGRVDLLLKAGVLWTLVRRGYYPVVVSQSICFKRSLEPFQSFRMVTKLDAWDERDFFMTQTFFRGKELAAEGYIKGRFKHRKRKGSVPTAEVFAAIGIPFSGLRSSDLAQAQTRIESLLTQSPSVEG